LGSWSSGGCLVNILWAVVFASGLWWRLVLALLLLVVLRTKPWRFLFSRWAR